MNKGDIKIGDKDVENLILTHKEERESGKTFPYNLILENGGQSIFYIGGDHSTDPTDEEYSIIDRYWEVFVKEEGERIVLVEGGEWEYVADPEEAIQENGEPTYMKHLAVKNNIECVCAEPNFKDEIEYLLESFDRDTIFYFWLSRYIRQWPSIMQTWPENEEAYLRSQMEYLKESTGWEDFDFSVEAFSRIHTQLYATALNISDYEHFTNESGPNESGTVINKVSSASSRFRDIHVVSLIKKYWDEGKNIFIVFGWTHVVRQEPAVRAITE